jgi:hypothetical protein
MWGSNGKQNTICLHNASVNPRLINYHHVFEPKEISTNVLVAAGTLDEDGCQSQQSAARGVDEETGKNGSLLLPTKNDLKESVSVLNCCAICLEDYKVGEVVVWSCCPGGGCPHIYHRDCMVDYLVSYRVEGSPCPSCS